MSEKVEVKYINDREVWVDKNRIFLRAGNIFHVIVEGPQSIDQANASLAVYKKISNLVKGKLNHLIDLNKAGKSSPEARKIWKEMSENDNTNKVAVIGIHPVARVLASFVLSVIQKGNTRFFQTEEEGLKWLLDS